MKVKWLSLNNHIHNVHSNHHELFPTCAHEPLDGREHKKYYMGKYNYIYRTSAPSTFLALTRNDILYTPNSCIISPFFLADSKASEKLSALMTNPQLCKDIMRLSSLYQTSSLESFHSVIIHFAPKSAAFSYNAMQSR